MNMYNTGLAEVVIKKNKDEWKLVQHWIIILHGYTHIVCQQL